MEQEPAEEDGDEMDVDMFSGFWASRAPKGGHVKKLKTSAPASASAATAGGTSSNSKPGPRP